MPTVTSVCGFSWALAKLEIVPRFTGFSVQSADSTICLKSFSANIAHLKVENTNLHSHLREVSSSHHMPVDHIATIASRIKKRKAG